MNMEKKGFKDLFIEVKEEFFGLKMGFYGDLIGLSSFKIKGFTQGIELQYLKLAISNNKERDSVFRKEKTKKEGENSHFFIGLEIFRRKKGVFTEEKSWNKVFFVDFSTGEPVKASFENFEKLLMELSAKIQRKERKLLQFYKKFNELNRFL